MHRRLIAVYVAIVAAWMQLLAPLAMADVRADVDPFSIICSHRSDGPDHGSKPHKGTKVHHCCLACHVQLVGPTPDDRPVFTTIDYPIASPRRWLLAADPPRAGPAPRQHRPRGPPSLS